MSWHIESSMSSEWNHSGSDSARVRWAAHNGSRPLLHTIGSSGVRTMRWTKLIAVVAVLASVPLFFTYQIKHVLFPRGYLFVFMYSAALLSVLVVPILFVVEMA